MFNLAIDSKLRGCDVVAIKVEDVAPNRYAVERATVRKRKTGRPVKFELTEQTRQAIEDYLRASGRTRTSADVCDTTASAAEAEMRDRRVMSQMCQ